MKTNKTLAYENGKIYDVFKIGEVTTEIGGKTFIIDDLECRIERKDLRDCGRLLKLNYQDKK